MNEKQTAMDKYRAGYDQISWSNTPRPGHQGGVRRIELKPFGTIIDVPGGVAFPQSGNIIDLRPVDAS